MYHIMFRKEHPFEKREAEASRLLAKYPDRVPIIVEKVEKTELPELDKKKYLAPVDLTAGQFLYVLRKRLQLKPEKAMFLFTEKTKSLPAGNTQMGEIHQHHRDEDGFLYLLVSAEETFGG